MKLIYLDIDGVLSLGSEMHPKLTRWGYVHRFNAKAVKILNEILKETNADIVVSSDWKDFYSLNDLQEIFIWQKVSKAPIDVTKSLPGKTLQLLEEVRAREILEHADKIKPASWVAIDDLDLRFWIPSNHFTICCSFMEGIKQTGKKQEIINKLIL
jgi:hypothetical protein